MSLYDDASLIMFPSGYKEDKIYSLKPTDGSGDLTFTRASTATRVNADGLIEKVRTNLVTYSEQLDNAEWTKGGVGTFTSAITTGFVGPFGDNDAQRYVATIASVSDRAFVRQLATLTSGITYSVSFWVKSNTGSSQDIYFMFQGGAVQATTATTSWQRISYSATTSTTSVLVGIEAKDLTIDILIYGFQLEVGDVMTEYIPTTTAAVSVGMLADVPRIDYTGGGCGKLLLEPQRTNLVKYSEQFDDALWQPASTTVSANQATSPDGTQNADLIYPTLSSSNLGVYQNTTGVTGVVGTVSCYVKSAGKNWALLGTDNTSTYNVSFDLVNGVVGSVPTGYTATIESVGNGWYRITATFQSGSSLSYPFVGVADNTNRSVTADGTNGLYIWGFQAEIGSYVSSYVPTLASSVTRLADAALTSSVPSLIGQTEGVLFIDFNRIAILSPSAFMISAIAGSTSNSYLNSIYIYQLSNGNIVVENFVAGVQQFGFSSAGLSVGKHKIALGYKLNDFVLYIDGVQIGTDNSGSVPAMNFLTINGTADVPNTNQSVNQAQLYKTRLTNAELATLTTL